MAAPIVELAVFAMVVGALACRPAGEPAASGSPSSPSAPAAPETITYVGSHACVECHTAEVQSWLGSHHDRAMEEVSESTVLGDFDGATFEHAGVVSTFSRREGKYFVRTDGPDGALHDYEIAYTFGVDPLQQYLVAFPGGRYQALGIAWDSRPREQGGQRWFHLYPEHPPAPGDPLHWTGIDQTWNHMCAECHSTNLRKGYRADGDSLRDHLVGDRRRLRVVPRAGLRARRLGARRRREGSTRGSRRRFAASTGESLGLVVRLHDRALDGWEMNPETGTVRRTAPPPSRLELETCARCHSRRGLLDERYVNGRPLLDTHRPALLDQGLYFADGQIQRRGLRVRLVPAEQDARGGRDLQRLPRPAQPRAAGARATRCAPAATRRSASPSKRIITIPSTPPARAASSATCPSAPTW